MNDKRELIEQIDALLPQTQCGQCGFSGCLPYAAAIAANQADINQCPPGDVEGIRKLAALLGKEFKPLNTAHGLPKPKAVAFINEEHCIGCTFCIQACPVDAIIGAAKLMHTVISEECTGCEKCIAPCPVDCISMLPVAPFPENQAQEMKQNAANRARARHQFRLQRLEREKQSQADKFAQQSLAIDKSQPTPENTRSKNAAVQAAIERALANRTRIIDNN